MSPSGVDDAWALTQSISSGRHAGVVEGDRRRPRRLATVGPRLDHVERVGRRAVAHDLGVGLGAARPGDLLGLEHEEGVAPSPMTNPSRSASNGRQAWLGSSLWPSDSARMMSNAPKASGLSGTSAPPAIAASIVAGPDRVQRLADRDRAGRARVGGREDRPADVERDPEVGRRRPAEDRQGEVRGDGLDPALEIALVLLLGVGDPAERAAEVDPDPLRGPRRPPRPAAARRRRGRAGRRRARTG